MPVAQASHPTALHGGIARLCAAQTTRTPLCRGWGGRAMSWRTRGPVTSAGIEHIAWRRVAAHCHQWAQQSCGWLDWKAWMCPGFKPLLCRVWQNAYIASSTEPSMTLSFSQATFSEEEIGKRVEKHATKRCQEAVIPSVTTPAWSNLLSTAFPRVRRIIQGLVDRERSLSVPNEIPKAASADWHLCYCLREISVQLEEISG